MASPSRYGTIMYHWSDNSSWSKEAKAEPRWGQDSLWTVFDRVRSWIQIPGTHRLDWPIIWHHTFEVYACTVYTYTTKRYKEQGYTYMCILENMYVYVHIMKKHINMSVEQKVDDRGILCEDLGVCIELVPQKNNFLRCRKAFWVA